MALVNSLAIIIAVFGHSMYIHMLTQFRAVCLSAPRRYSVQHTHKQTCIDTFAFAFVGSEKQSLRSVGNSVARPGQASGPRLRLEIENV